MSPSGVLAKTTNVNNQKEQDQKKRISFGDSIKQKLKSTTDNTSDTGSSSGSSKHLPPPLKITRVMDSNNGDNVNNSELAKQLQKLKKTPTPATPPSSTSSGSRHSSIEIGKNNEPETSAEKKLFEVVVVVKLKRGASDKLEPTIDYEFPPQNVRSNKDLKLVNTIPLFCCKYLYEIFITLLVPDIDTVKEESSLSGGDK